MRLRGDLLGLLTMAQTKLSSFIPEDAVASHAGERYVDHLYIKPQTIVVKQYQIDIARSAVHENTAVKRWVTNLGNVRCRVWEMRYHVISL
jgi:hypothetical protein